MEEKELFKSFNGINYSDEEIKEYINLGNMSSEDLSIISGAVRSKLGREGIKRSNKAVNKQLIQGEEVNCVVKVRNVKVIKALTLSSAVGGTMGYGLDYGIFNTMYFTDKRIFFVDQNVINSPMFYRNIREDEVLGIRFTNREIKIVNDEEGKPRISLYTNRFKIFALIQLLLWIILFIVSLNFKTTIRSFDIAGLLGGISVFSLIIGLIGILKWIQDMVLDRIKIVLKNGYVWDVLIASYDYEKCRKYLKKLSKKYE